MSTYLFTWNPLKWDWENDDPGLSSDVETCRQRGHLDFTWTSSGSKKILKHDRVFLIRLGSRKPSGIMASGFVREQPYQGEHWSGEAGRKALYVDLCFDVLLHPLRDPLLERSILEEQIPAVHWTPQFSGMTIKPAMAAHLEFLWSTHLTGLGLSPFQGAEEVIAPERYWEGAVRHLTVNAYERNPRARSACVRLHGCKCVVCGFDFETIYGEIGKGFIHVHHVKPLAEIGEEYEIDPKSDLRPVCPNCHAMLHWRTPPFSCEELRAIRHHRELPEKSLPTAH